MIVINPIINDRYEVMVNHLPSKVLTADELLEFLCTQLNLDMSFDTWEDEKLDRIEKYLEEQMKSVMDKVKEIVEEEE